MAIGGFGLLVGVLLAYGLVSSGRASEGDTPVVEALEWLGDVQSGAQDGLSDESSDDSISASHSGDTDTAGENAEPDDAEVEIDKYTKRGTLTSGVAVMTSLTHMGLSPADAHGLITALDGTFDFRKARPGEKFLVRLDPQTGKPSYFSYEVSIAEVYEVERRGDALVGRRKHIPTKKFTRRYGGTISSSLYKTLDDHGAGPSLTAKVVEVLSSVVNFYNAQRPGDTFRVIVEEETLGEKSLGYGPVLALEYTGVKSGKKRFFRYESGDESTYYDEKGISLPRSVLAIPVSYSRISSTFGMRFHPVLRRKKFHNGVDFAASPGTPIWAATDGTVQTAGSHGPNGNLVVIDHGEGLISYYAHLLRFGSGIRAGVQVRRKQVIGQVGNTGRSTGPHLHYGLKLKGKFIDPLKYKVRPGSPPPAKDRAAVAEALRRGNSLLDATPIRPPSEPLSAHGEEETIMGYDDDNL